MGSQIQNCKITCIAIDEIAPPDEIIQNEEMVKDNVNKIIRPGQMGEGNIKNILCQ